MTEKGKIFRGYAEQIIAHHGFGSNKMVALQPDYWTSLDNAEAWKMVDELISAGYLRKHYTERTTTHKYGFTVKQDTFGRDWIGLTEKGWSVAQKYLDAEI